MEEQLAQLKENNLEKLEAEYFTKYAKHNEDFDGCEKWIEDLSEEEVKKIIK